MCEECVLRCVGNTHYARTCTEHMLDPHNARTRAQQILNTIKTLTDTYTHKTRTHTRHEYILKTHIHTEDTHTYWRHTYILKTNASRSSTHTHTHSQHTHTQPTNTSNTHTKHKVKPKKKKRHTLAHGRDPKMRVWEYFVIFVFLLERPWNSALPWGKGEARKKKEKRSVFP